MSRDPEQLRKVENMLLMEMERNGRIMVRSIDKIHAKTGLSYTVISEMAGQLQKRTSYKKTA
ncbi:MAG: hypothetical protein HY913_13020 [Desulfomonile tiedjei]|nr:hypothetical protein [Desulfomonile tiedjei]